MNILLRAAAPLALFAALACGRPAEAAVTVDDDPVLYWNQIMLDTVAPTGAIRVYAMMNIAMHDAVNATSGYRDVPYLNGVLSSGGLGGAAAAQAAHDVLVGVNPAASARYDAALAASLARYADGGAKASGVLTGQAYAAAMIANRANDGAFASVAYTLSGLPGRYAPTPPGFGPPITPQWADVTPFLLTSPGQFRPGPPPALGSQAYADALNEVKEVGSLTSGTRTADQTAAALFWAPSNGSTFMRIALDVGADKGLSTLDNARLFARVGTGIADTLITLWNTKYEYDFWRPVTAIQRADTDGNDLTAADAEWRSLITAPPHPSYMSGHSALSAVAAAILLDGIGDQRFCATLGANTRCWGSLGSASLDAADSRLWGGIHFRFDNEAALAAGAQVAQWELASGVFGAAAVPEPGAWALMIVGFGLAGVALRRRARDVSAALKRTRASPADGRAAPVRAYRSTTRLRRGVA